MDYKILKKKKEKYLLYQTLNFNILIIKHYDKDMTI